MKIREPEPPSALTDHPEVFNTFHQISMLHCFELMIHISCNNGAFDSNLSAADDEELSLIFPRKQLV